VYGGVTHDMSRANIYAKAGRRRTIWLAKKDTILR
jgi:hypothetical protein